MAYFWADNLHTTALTPRDYQVELLATAREKNLIICLAHHTSKEFIALKLLHELGFQLRRNNSNKISLYLTKSPTVSDLVRHLTDLRVLENNFPELGPDELETVFTENQVVVFEPRHCLDSLRCGYLDLNQVNLIIIDECHKINGETQIIEIFTDYYKDCIEKPKILGLAGPLHNADCPPGRLSAELQYLESVLHSKAETASDIVTVLRYCSKPIEILLQCAPPKENELAEYIRGLILTRKAFIKDHRYDPSEIYGGEEFLDELKDIPDPKIEPLRFLDEFLYVLEELGCWCADKAALNLLLQLEKLKVKTPYERHFLLLCLVSTTFIQIRSFCEHIFYKIDNEKERVLTYSTPKILRVLEVFRLFKPDDPAPENKKTETKITSSADQCTSEKCQSLLNEIDSLKFDKLVDKLSDSIATLSIDDKNATISQNDKNKSPSINNRGHNMRNNQRFRNRKKLGLGPRPNYQRLHHMSDPSVLCAIIFCNSKLTTKILFNLFYEMSRHDPDLKYLNVQYTVDKVRDPMTESTEAESEHRKQEEVLKRFRIHECNLLIGTSVLEEGIDLPKCNLVVRWDPPSCYRSYVQCKGRARASLAYHVIMISPKPSEVSSEFQEYLSEANHRFACNELRNPERLKGYEESSSEDDDTDDSPKITEVNSDGEDIEKEAKRKRQIEIINSKCVYDDTEDSFDDSDENKYDEQIKQMETSTNEMIERIAQYMEIEKMLIRKCENVEPPESEFQHAEQFTSLFKPYKPLEDIADGASVNLSNAIQLVNKYCAKLPSDTFTKLTALWRCARTIRNGVNLYQYTIRLPINSPLKQDVVGLPMTTRVLARRMAALITCKVLHKSGELDDMLQPIGKEGFRPFEPDWENFDLDEIDEKIVNENSEPRPGTTKRRQYYYKRIASAFSNCRPVPNTAVYLYQIAMVLQCPIPEEQNTRGRKIYPPEESPQGFGILTLKKIPKISSFPIFTRSGEVKVSLELVTTGIQLTEEQISKINLFINYTFTNVLRLQKYLMLFDPSATENCFFIIPTIRTDNNTIEVDWPFLSIIAKNVNKMPQFIPDTDRRDHNFDPNKFKDAVVMPWYRNQDQPQYFYVAEICYHLSPESSFPGESYSTFKEYYFKKYNIEIQNCKQPLLDVDHTSARLNFLTPRYINRKGVALPTSSEETKRAKRENLEQKQILVPELCTIHPFPASLWREAVCLPCILYRYNALLLADEIRKEVSYDLGLGQINIEDETFEWPMLNFGWSLADVLKKSRDAKLQAAQLEADSEPKEEAKDSSIDKEEFDANKEKTVQEKTANDKLAEAEGVEAPTDTNSEDLLEIGTWSNDMAENISIYSDDEMLDHDWGRLPPNIDICSTNNKNKIRYGSPTTWDAGGSNNFSGNKMNSNDPYYSDSDDSFVSDNDSESSSDENNVDTKKYGLRIEFKSDNLAEAIESEEDILKRQKQIDIINIRNLNEINYQNSKNLTSGYNSLNEFNCGKEIESLENSIDMHEDEFKKSIVQLKNLIQTSGMVVRYDSEIKFVRKREKNNKNTVRGETNSVSVFDLVPYLDEEVISNMLCTSTCDKITVLNLEDLYKINEYYVDQCGPEQYIIEGSGDIFDCFNDTYSLVLNENNEKVIPLCLKEPEFLATPDPNPRESVVDQHELMETAIRGSGVIILKDEETDGTVESVKKFSFDYQPDLNYHPGPSPSIILQALTMSNANDGINLERLETIGDSFLKYAITTYLYCTYENVHEGKLSHLRSKQVSNLNLYRLGRKKVLGESMIATKFEPHDNWLPPCYYVPKELEQALIDAQIPACFWHLADVPNIKTLTCDEICAIVKDKMEKSGLMEGIDAVRNNPLDKLDLDNNGLNDSYSCFIPYNLITQHSIPDKSVADCVEALIGAYLISCGPRGALLFMAWLGIRVLPIKNLNANEDDAGKIIKRIPGSTRPFIKNNTKIQTLYGEWEPPKSPLLKSVPNAHNTLELLLDGYWAFEDILGYKFRDRSYLLQAMTHASYSPNRLTDCYQRLEFLGDAVLDYLITRHLYEDPRQHSPGALTDLRSALVNNTIFASLAVRHGFHKYFRHLSPGLNEVIDRFVRIQHENDYGISEEFYLKSEDECDEAEDVEVPKALGDVFESVAGAIFLDSNMSLDCVWKVYSNMMRPEIEQFSNSVPKSPIRELLELEPETAKFGKPEKLADGRRVRVTVEVFGKGTFRGIGRNYRIAKCTAAKCALRQLKKQGLITKRH